MAKVTHAFEVKFNDCVDGRYGVSGGYVDLPGSQFHYGSETYVKHKAKQEVKAFIERAILDLDPKNRKRCLLGTNEGAVFLVYYDNGWCHHIAGLARLHGGMTCGNWETFESARAAAIRHIDDAYCGVAWETFF